ncbi:hypothetical protein BJ878DRAFT_554552 [Calycina marina]|uniref:Uncharacterized protein n=1 Tax=Calycina marina TaxID=1763456 RepID=A0A9P7Z8X1_9HELO|nr:hypothetical protein BJ878DRAFT_554552 [Calycina marina]
MPTDGINGANKIEKNVVEHGTEDEEEFSDEDASQKMTEEEFQQTGNGLESVSAANGENEDEIEPQPLADDSELNISTASYTSSAFAPESLELYCPVLESTACIKQRQSWTVLNIETCYHTGSTSNNAENAENDLECRHSRNDSLISRLHDARLTSRPEMDSSSAEKNRDATLENLTGLLDNPLSVKENRDYVWDTIETAFKIIDLWTKSPRLQMGHGPTTESVPNFLIPQSE